MGAWGAGLYSGDYAMDLRSTIAAVARLPFSPVELLSILRESEADAADDSDNSDHTIFWLVAADQFHKRGLDCSVARERALAIIADGEDQLAMARLGMDEKSLAKRKAGLDQVAARLRGPLPNKPRKVLKGPQPFVLEVGEAVAYPVNAQGDPINPYLVGKPWAIAKSWTQAAWGALVALERGHVFEHLAWYQVIAITRPFVDRPALADLWANGPWLRRNVGTLTDRHSRAMQFETLGVVRIDRMRLFAAFHGLAEPKWAATNDIAIANYIAAREPNPASMRAIVRRVGSPQQIERLAVVADSL